MMKGSDIAAADLDHCLDPETAALDPWAEELHTAANGAYREVTASGCGLRIIGTAKGAEVHTRVTFDRETGAGLALYRDAARFITVSGNQFGSCAALAPLDDFIDTLEKRYSNGAKGKTRGFDCRQTAAIGGNRL
jgi:primase-polymerase (primpol)-like protein